MDKWNQQLIDVLMKSRNVSSLGNRNRQKQGRESKGASLSSFFGTTTEINKAQLIHKFIFS